MAGQNSGYSLEELCPSVYAIDDRQEESMYLVCGRERALMIEDVEELISSDNSASDRFCAFAMHARSSYSYFSLRTP